MNSPYYIGLSIEVVMSTASRVLLKQWCNSTFL